MRQARIAVACSACLVQACGPSADPDLGSATDSSDAAAATATADRLAGLTADPRLLGADLARGEILSYACQACHTLRAGEPPNIGPNLFGVFGRAAATREGFEYSAALAASGIVWTTETVEAWLASPNDYVPETKMVFAGYGDPSDRRDLIAYLLLATSARRDP